MATTSPRGVVGYLTLISIALTVLGSGCKAQPEGTDPHPPSASKPAPTDDASPATSTASAQAEATPAAAVEDPPNSVDPPRSKPDTPTECSDGKDNDGDGLVDWQQDLGCYGADDQSEGGLPTRTLDQGWTVFEPSPDTRIIYVSSSRGNDRYPGTSPRKPKKTLAAAIAIAREGRPDWVLLARGDTWQESLTVKEGRSRSEPFVVASFGDSTARPLLETGADYGITRPQKKRYNDFAIVGLAFRAHTRDPRSKHYLGTDGESAFKFYAKAGETGKGVLIEDCHFDFYTGGSFQGPGLNEDIWVRRSIFTNSYSVKGHAQGMYSKEATLLLEENVFDHNGWYKRQVDEGNDKEDGQATMFNHNIYMVNQRGTIARRNIFMRPSSIGTKWTANGGPNSASDIVIENNLYVDAEVAITIGGNDKVSPHRFKSSLIKDNVMVDVGRSRQTNRDLGWCMRIDDWDGGKVVNNLCVHQPREEVANVRALLFEGVTRDVTVADNVFHGLFSKKALIFIPEGSSKERVVFRNNVVSNAAYDTQVIQVRDGLGDIRFDGNAYFTGRSDDRWFKVDRERGDIATWNRMSGGTDKAQQVRFSDPSRSIETYQKSIGEPPSIDAFVAAAISQSKYAWRPEYTAEVINDWFRAGFDR